jgi:hypothetical protein
MPVAYERVRDSLIKQGKSRKMAKKIAAMWWNKHHPDNANPWLREKKKKRT